MSDTVVLASFGVGYVLSGLLLLSLSLGGLSPKMKWVPIKVRSRRPQ